MQRPHLCALHCSRGSPRLRRASCSPPCSACSSTSPPSGHCASRQAPQHGQPRPALASLAQPWPASPSLGQPRPATARLAQPQLGSASLAAVELAAHGSRPPCRLLAPGQPLLAPEQSDGRLGPAVPPWSLPEAPAHSRLSRCVGHCRHHLLLRRGLQQDPRGFAGPLPLQLQPHCPGLARRALRPRLGSRLLRLQVHLGRVRRAVLAAVGPAAHSSGRLCPRARRPSGLHSRVAAVVPPPCLALEPLRGAVTAHRCHSAACGPAGTGCTRPRRRRWKTRRTARRCRLHAAAGTAAHWRSTERSPTSRIGSRVETGGLATSYKLSSTFVFRMYPPNTYEICTPYIVSLCVL